MARRLIGIDPGEGTLRVAIAAVDKGRARLVATGEKPWRDPQELPGLLQELIGGEPKFGDRLAAALPASAGFVRRLHFPFADQRKIAAALSFELSGRLPLGTDDAITDFQHPSPEGGERFSVMAAAVPEEAIETFLEPFEQAGIPLHILDLQPFALSTGLRSVCEEGILVHLAPEEVTISLVRNGRTADLRILRGTDPLSEGELAAEVLRQALALRHETGAAELPLYLLGPGATETLAECLREEGAQPRQPAVFADGRAIAPAFLPAAALALRAAVPAKTKEFNFRRGRFTVKSEWAALKKSVVAAAILLTCSGLALGSGAYFNYARKAARAEALKQQITQIYRNTFSASGPIVNVPMQARQKITELEKKGRVIGTGASASPLNILRELSRKLPEGLPLKVKNLNYTPERLRVEGATASFDAVNRLVKSWQGASGFRDVQLTDAKMAVDGENVDFRINVLLQEGEGQG